MNAPRAQRWWWLVWVAIAIALVGRAAGRKPEKGVLLDHLEFGRRLMHGEDVYGPWRSDKDAPVLPLHAPYPPSFGLLTAPFHLVDATSGLRAARTAWALLQLASLVAIAVLLRRLSTPRAPPLPEPTERRWPWLWLLTFLATMRFVLRDTHGGGGNLINVALALLALHASERGRDRAAGAWLAFSLVTKPTMVWLLPVFALFGRWRTLRWTAAAGGAFVLLTMALQRFDIAPWWRWLQGSLAMATMDDPWAAPAFDFPPFTWMNQALRFLVARWCGSVPDEFAARVALGVWPGLGFSTTAVGWLVRGVSLLLLLAVLRTAWRARHSAEGRLATVAATLVLALLLSPISWKGHHVALVPIVLLLLQQAWWQGRTGLWWVLGGFVAMCVMPGGDLVGDAADEWLNSLYVVPAWDLVLLGCGLAVALRSARSSSLEHQEIALARRHRESGR